MRGESRVEAVMAWALEGAFEGLSARFWMGLQSDYDLGMAKLALEH
jgi:plasmid maintenance system antidote protein VapI